MAISSSKNCPQCGSNHKGKPFAVYEDSKHCFSCGWHKSYENNFETKVQKVPEYIKMPKRGTINTANLKWLRQYHVADAMINKYGIYQSLCGSIVMPIEVNGRVERVNQRWINPRRDYAQGNFKAKPVIEHNDGVVILVEDYISWIRVGERYTSCLLSGTTATNETLKTLLSRYDTIILWLDNDAEKEPNPGQEAARKIIKRLSYIIRQKYALLNKGVVNIVTDDDPKCYTDSEINSIIKEHTDVFYKKPV